MTQISKHRQSKAVLSQPLAVLTHLADAVIAADESGLIVYLNAASEALLGWRLDELYRQPLARLVPERMKHAHKVGFDKFVSTGQGRLLGQSVRVPALHRSGHEINIELKLSLFMPPGAPQPLVVASLRDLRAGIELERQITTQRRLLAQHTVMSILATSETVEQAAPRVLEALCIGLSWDVGILWWVDEQLEALYARTIWGSSDQRAQAFAACSRAIRFRCGEGLPGVVWRNKEPLWCQDFAGDAHCLRAKQARQYGFQEAKVFPILAKGRLLGVLEFINRTRCEPDEELTQTLATACFQIGSFDDRLRAEHDSRVQETFERFLGVIGAWLTESFDYREALTKISTALTQNLADACLMHLYSDEQKILTMQVCSPPSLRMKLKCDLNASPCSHEDDSCLLFRAANFVYHSQQEIIREPPHCSELPEDVAKCVKDVWHRLDIGNFILIPIAVRGICFGTLCVWHHTSMAKQHARFAAFVRDLAQRIAYALDSARLFFNAQRAISARDNFLSIASHELKTPITSLQLQAQSLMRNGAALPKRLDIKLRAVVHQVHRLNALITRLLDLSDVATSNVSLKEERIDLAMLVRTIVTRFSRQRPQSTAPLYIRAPEHLVGIWDAQRLEQIIANVLGNATKFGGNRAVSVALSKQGDVACLSIEDHGIGIAEENLERIFERYEQAVPFRQFGGFGLGLWVARQLTEASGGQITVSSVLGQGSTFNVYLPC